MPQPEVEDNIHKGMYRDSQREDSASQVASRDKPALCPAYGRVDGDLICSEPLNVQ